MSFASRDLHSAPPLLFHDMPSPSDQPSQSLFSLPQPTDHWSAYDQAFALQASMCQFNSYPTSAPRLTPPLPPSTNLSGGPRLTLAGSLDPTTGIFYRTPEHPRLRTAQACEKCRTRKAKCSGEHPSCKRCQNRGLVCEYAKEGRVRGPNKPKNGKVPTPVDEPRHFPQRGRTSEPADLSQAMIESLREHEKRLALAGASPISSRRGSLSMGEHRPNRPRPPNLKLDIGDGHFDPHLHFQIAQNDHLRFNGTIHTAPPIPVSYQGIHMGAPGYAYEENRSPSTSSSTSMHLQNTYLRGSVTNSPPSLAYPADVVPHYGTSTFETDVKAPVPVAIHSHGNMANIDAALVSLSMDPQVVWSHEADPNVYPLDFQMQ